jgi:hypothetical protein
VKPREVEVEVEVGDRQLTDELGAAVKAPHIADPKRRARQ